MKQLFIGWKMTILWTHPPERLLASVGANVLPQVAERRKVLCASLRFTVERLACVESLVCFQSADTIAAASLKVKPKRRRQSENSVSWDSGCPTGKWRTGKHLHAN